MNVGEMLEWAYVGVNTTVPRNGGPECAEYLSWQTRVVETALVMGVALPGLLVALRKITPLSVDLRQRAEPPGKRLLLVTTCLIWGIEIGFKFSSRTVIFLLNPCHVTTALQIYLLAARPSKAVAVIFRFQMNCLNGSILALAFPELDALNLPFETWLYWIQHTMMMVIPLYLLQLGGVYETERLSDMTWSAVSFCILLIYHFIILQGIGTPAQVNLNHMLCPAVRDPFGGPWYRPMAVVHQAILCPALSKAFSFLGKWMRSPDSVPPLLVIEAPKKQQHLD